MKDRADGIPDVDNIINSYDAVRISFYVNTIIKSEKMLITTESKKIRDEIQETAMSRLSVLMFPIARDIAHSGSVGQRTREDADGLLIECMNWFEENVKKYNKKDGRAARYFARNFVSIVNGERGEKHE